VTVPDTAPAAPERAAGASMRVLFCNWRDTRHPEGGGSEVYVESVARALAAAGDDVTILCARYPGSVQDEVHQGVRYHRVGSKLGVYPRVLLTQALRRLGRFDVVVDVQNGVPFASTLATRSPVVNLVHHVHREQWPVVYGPLRSRIGWFLESQVGPLVYRRSRYVAVSDVTRRELVELGVSAPAVSVVHNGVEAPRSEPCPTPGPTLLVLGRLVPHKQVEHVFTVAARLRAGMPDLRVRVVGDGWWGDELRAEALRLGVDDIVDFVGFVDEDAKHEHLAQSWVLVLPSLKEGWGLVVMEAAGYRVPTVAYRSAGGVTESVVDHVTGLLVDDVDGLTEAVRTLVEDPELRRRLGMAAAARADEFAWDTTARLFAHVLAQATGRPAPVVATPPAHVHHGEPDMHEAATPEG
jgi:glycosyltransferase involved in cell wall biosynthesis